MSYHTHKTLQTYWDALAHYNLQENQVSNFRRRGSVLIINTPQKVYFKSIDIETIESNAPGYGYSEPNGVTTIN